MKRRIKLLSFWLLSAVVINRYENDYKFSSQSFERHMEIEKNRLTLDEIEKRYYDFFDNYKVKYNFSKGLASSKDVEKLDELAASKQECDFQFIGSNDQLVAQIIDNTNKYIEKHPSSNYINALDSDDVDLAYRAVVLNLKSTLRDEIALIQGNQLSSNNNEDLCKLSDLVVLLYTKPIDNDLYGDYVNKDNKITIYLDNVTNIYYPSIDFFTQLSEIFLHEIDHARQHICKDREEKGELSFNKYVSSIVESSAESAIYNENNSEYYSDMLGNENIYFSERCFEDELQLLTLTDEDTNLNDYYASIFDSDIDAFLDYFNIKTDKDKKAFLNILREKDAALLRNNIAKDIAFADDLTVGEASDVIGYGYKVEIIRLALRNVIAINMEREEKFTPLKLSLYGNVIFNMACQGTVTESGKQDERFIEQVNIFRKIYESYISDTCDISKELAADYMELMINCEQDEYYYVKETMGINEKFSQDVSFLTKNNDTSHSYKQIVKTKTLKR